MRAALFVVLLVFSISRPGWAHEVGLSRGDYTLTAATLTARLTFARRDLVTIVAGLDADGNGVLDATEVERGRAGIENAVVRRIDVSADGARCPGTLTDARLAEQDGVTASAEFHCLAAPAKLRVDLPLLDDLPYGHRHLARAISSSTDSTPVLFSGHRSFELTGATATPPASWSGGSLALFTMGVEHILTGYDHLVFLFGVVVVGGRLRSIVMVVTAFTLAHSITLALAVLGVWAPSSRLVEPAIALSIAYVGAENFFVADAARRWRITFPFGLIHGFGFAGALQALAMRRSAIPGALVLFNLGVEVGQLGVLTVMLPLVYLAHRRIPWFSGVGVKVLSGGVILAGLVWFVSRIA